MPINLSEYTPRIRDSLKRGGFACVYVVSAPEGTPSRATYAVNLWQAVSDMQRVCPIAIWVHEVLWVPDRAIATGIAKLTHAAFAHKMLHGGWIDVPSSQVIEEMQIKAFQMYPGATMMTHHQLIAQQNVRRSA